MSIEIQKVVRKIQELRCDLSAYRAEGDFAAVQAGLKELRAAQRELDHLVEARQQRPTTPTPAWI